MHVLGFCLGHDHGIDWLKIIEQNTIELMGDLLASFEVQV